MNTKFFKDHFQTLNLKLKNENIKNFIPIISQDFEKDKINFSNFWKECDNENIKIKNNKNKRKIRKLVEVTKKIFLNDYSKIIYNQITANRNKFVKIDELVFSANNVVPYLTPSKEQLEIENKKILKDKEGIETDQGLFLSSVLSNQLEGNHLCHSMLLPSDLALEKQEEFNKIKKCSYFANLIGIEVHAGHGLTYSSAMKISKIKSIKELNIGHFLVGESLLNGMNKTILKFKRILI